ncbi:MAG: glyoxalase [Actinophytocola sp.]|uniref:VOC family protein n=1 Tax=Actinophytocola sp. TaxID=1872138 RepID=UPI00132C796F|nr:VOC family protein [Actinophytocola sp.]MPZ80442.1 glyoxalase [Actinophytocola sp.]
MSDGYKTIIYPVSDLEKAKAVFGALLGVEPEMDQPYYVGYKVAGQDIGLDPNGHKKGMTGPITYLHVDDIKATRQALLDASATPNDDIKDVGGGRLVGSVKDADGNVIGLIQG